MRTIQNYVHILDIGTKVNSEFLCSLWDWATSTIDVSRIESLMYRKHGKWELRKPHLKEIILCNGHGVFFEAGLPS